MTHFKAGTTVPATGIYWCTVCKTPRRFNEGEIFPECNNLCGRGLWEMVRNEGEKPPARG